MSDDDITDSPETRALRKQILDCCKGHDSKICFQVLFGMVIRVMEENATGANQLEAMFDELIRLIASIAVAHKTGKPWEPPWKP